MTQQKELIIFDLDGTLTASKSPLESEMAELLVRLLAKMKVAVISGGGFSQFEIQFLSKLPVATGQFGNLFLLPTSGTKLYVWQGSWQEQYSEELSGNDKKKIIENLHTAFSITNYQAPEKTYGETIEDRGSQITFSALGQQAPLELKNEWDPTRTKRQAIVDVLKRNIPEFDSRIGGATSIDITMKGVNKAYGIRKLSDFLNLPIDKMIFVGDALYQEGNDYPAKSTGVQCIQVSGPEETKKVISDLLAQD